MCTYMHMQSSWRVAASGKGPHPKGTGEAGDSATPRVLGLGPAWAHTAGVVELAFVQLERATDRSLTPLAHLWVSCQGPLPRMLDAGLPDCQGSERTGLSIARQRDRSPCS